MLSRVFWGSACRYVDARDALLRDGGHALIVLGLLTIGAAIVGIVFTS